MKYSKLAEDLWPYLVSKVRRVNGAGGSGGGGGSVDMTAHELASTTALGTYHTVAGLTANQVLKATGASTAAFGQLSHTALSDLTSGDPHTQYLLESNADGAGLTYSGSTLVVGAGNGITVNADSVALTVPGTLTVATSNSASGSHTHAITTSSDVTAGGTAILSSNAGALALRALTVDGDDLSVEGIGSYDGYQVLVVDASAGSVGIMGTPDPQFALDVVGPARATYFIGPHAIQLKDVLLLAHFDGRMPFETNYAGAPNGHMGQVAAVGGGVIYRPGMFGTKALQMAEGKVNYVPNPSFEVNSTDGWSFFESGTGASRTRTSTRAYVGTYSCRIDPSSTGNAILYTGDILSVANGATVSASARLYRNSAGTAQIEIYDSTNSLIRATGTSAVANEWEYVSCTWTNSTGGAVNVRLRVLNTAGGTANALWVDACQVELGVNTPYIDGTLGGFTTGGVPDGTGHSWSGTAHNSTSSRVVANFQFPTTGNIDAARGTVMGWVWRAGVSSTDTLLRVDGSTAGLILLRGNGTQAQAYWGTASISGGTIAAGVWTHLAMTFNGTTLRLYVNGVEVASGAASGFDGMPATMGVGRSVAGANFLNGYLDDLCITSSTLPADGIRAVYESNAPVFAESSRFSFRATPKGLVWADDEGLWVRDTTGAAVLGVYGGEAATKSWGGETLAAGDLLIGTSAQYVKWDASAATLSVKGAIEVVGTIPNTSVSGLGALATKSTVTYGTGDVTGFGTLAAVNNSLDNINNGSTYARVNSTIISGGNIRVGAGTKDSDLDGWHISSTEIVGQLDGADQVVLDTSGQITWAAGNGVLNAAGAAIDVTGTSSYMAARAYSFKEGSTALGGVSGYIDGTTRALALTTESLSTDCRVDVNAATGSSYSAGVRIGAASVTGLDSRSATLSLYAKASTAASTATLDAATITLEHPFYGLDSSLTAVTVNGSISTPNDDIQYLFGKAVVGKVTTSAAADAAYFANRDINTHAGAALIQNASGDTYLQAASGRTGYIRENGTSNLIATWTANGFESEKFLRIAEIASGPSGFVAADTEAVIYVRGNKFIVANKTSSTVKYRYMDLSSTNANWTYTTTEPT